MEVLKLEIGSIFDIPINNLFLEEKKIIKFPIEEYYKYKEKKFFNTGRSAIEFLFHYCIPQKKDEIILVPNYICKSVLDAIQRAGYKYKEYSITPDFDIDLKDLVEKITNKTKIILFLNYFGTAITENTANKLQQLKKNGMIIVEDDTQSIFSKLEGRMGIGNYIIASIRKWLPIPDGAVLYSETEKIPLIQLKSGYNEYSSLYLIAQLMKSKYIENEQLDKNLFLELTKQSTTALFSDYEIRDMTPIAQKLLTNINIMLLEESRRKNYKYLYNAFQKVKQIKTPVRLEANMVPFGMPILVDKRDKLLEYLIKNNIYCNVHWKNIIGESTAESISNRILTIPCDQRYAENEMKYIVSKINEFYKGE